MFPFRAPAERWGFLEELEEEAQESGRQEVNRAKHPVPANIARGGSHPPAVQMAVQTSGKLRLFPQS